MKPTFKCLSNPPAVNSEQPRSIPMKQKFSKLTLSSNKKTQQPQHNELDKPLTPTPKMLSFSDEDDDSSLSLTDDEDDNNEPLIAPALPQTSSLVNKILASSSSAASPTTARDLHQTSITPPNPCEGASFSQRLQLNDTDVTNCTELNPRRCSNIQPKPTVLQSSVEIALTQMDKLEITGSSEDLFSGDGNNPKPSSSSDLTPNRLTEAISDLSQRVDRIQLQEPMQTASTTASSIHRTSILTISSSSSNDERNSHSPSSQRRPNAKPVSTRSSLSTDDVYDVITLSDSQSDGSEVFDENDDDDNVNAQDPPLVQTYDDRLCNVPKVATGDVVEVNVAISQAIPTSAAESLPSAVQQQLDRFFDNIPLVPESAESETPNTEIDRDDDQLNEVCPSVGSVSHNTSLYVSETDEEEINSASALTHPSQPPQQQNIPVPKPMPTSPPTVTDIQSEQNPQTQSSCGRKESSSTEIIPTSSSHTANITTDRKNGTPVINIAAKFQIRIQVNHSESSSSSSAASSTSDRHDSSMVRAEDNSHANAADDDIGTQAVRMTEMHIAADEQQASETSHLSDEQIPASETSATSNVDLPFEPQQRNTPRSNRKPMQLEKLVSRKTSSTSATSSVGKKKRNAPKTVATTTTSSPPPPTSTSFVQAPPCIRTPEKPTKERIVLDDAAQRLLNELYGASWQTPDLMRKCVIRRPNADDQTRTAAKVTAAAPRVQTATTTMSTGKPVRGKAAVVNDTRNSHEFSLFRKNIHLDSTRIGNAAKCISKPTVQPVISNGIAPIEVGSPFFKKPIAKTTPLLSNRRSSMGVIKSSRKNKPNRILDSDEEDSNSEDIGNKENDSDYAQHSESDCSDSSSTESAKRSVRQTTAKKPVTPKARAKNSGKDLNITYLDLTAAEAIVVEQPDLNPDASEADLDVFVRRLEIGDFAFHKKTIEPSPRTPAVATTIATPVATTKRKLFNPYFEDLEHAARELCSPHHDITQERIVLPGFNTGADADEADKLLDEDPAWRAKLNDKLLPRSLLNLIGTTPHKTAASTKVVTPSSSKTAKPTPSRGIRTPSAAVTIAASAATTVEDIERTPCGTYSFLQSLEPHHATRLLHPHAVAFRDRFRTTKEKLTELLFALYCRRVFDNDKRVCGVQVTWNAKLKTTAGCCVNRRRGGDRSCTIELSSKVITSAERLRCTLVHEMCHAATWLLQGETGHGATWKRWASLAQARCPDLPPIQRCHAYEIEYKYVYQCTLCGAKSPAHSKSKRVETIRCAYCHGAIEVLLNKRDAATGEMVAVPVKKASGFAAFVKDKYRLHMEPGRKHAEVMRLLSGLYAALSKEEKAQY